VARRLTVAPAVGPARVARRLTVAPAVGPARVARHFGAAQAVGLARVARQFAAAQAVGPARLVWDPVRGRTRIDRALLEPGWPTPAVPVAASRPAQP
jgi:hypothetical protein